jgi:hypothetical protein
MNKVRYRLCLVMGIIIFLQLIGCSKKEAPVETAVRSSGTTLIDAMQEAAKLYAAGGQEYKSPQGMVIGMVRRSAGTQAEQVEIRGSQQKGKTLAVIFIRFPASWLANEKQKLEELKAESTAFTACAEKLRARESSGVPAQQNTWDTCGMKEINIDGTLGIKIQDKTLKHIEMWILATK